MIMKKLSRVFILLFVFIYKPTFSNIIIEDDLERALVSLYDYNPKLKYERELLKSKDELLPQAYSEFRPEIDGYYQKGKVDTNSQGFNITSDGIRTETSKGIIISQNIFDGGSSLSNIKVAKNEIFAQRYFLKNVEQEVFLEAIKLYADLATELSNLKLKQKNVEVLQGQLSLTKEQFEIGDVTLTDVSIAEARFSLAKSELLQSSNIINSLSAKFESFFGTLPEEPKIEIQINKLPYEINNSKKMAEKNNPKINNVVFQIKSIENQMQSLQRKRLPSVKLEAEAKINQGYFRTDSKKEVLSAFTKVDIPLYQSGAASSKIREFKKKSFALKELLNQTKKEIEYNLVSEMSSFEYSLSRIKAYKKQIKSNKIFLDGLKQELQLGERTTLDLLDGEQELLKSELDLVKAYRDFFVSYYGFIFYLGDLNAKKLNLPVTYFDENQNYDAVKKKWLDIIE